MLIRKPADIRPSEITSQRNYLNRRQFLQTGAIAGGSLLSGTALGAILPEGKIAEGEIAKLPDVRPSEYKTDRPANSYDDITTYNNFYEFGTRKDDPHRNARDFEPRPWTIEVDGHAEVTGRAT